MTRLLDTDFCCGLPPGLEPLEIGSGQVVQDTPGALLLRIGAGDGSRYSDAQVMDYAKLPRADYPDAPPLRMTVRAAFSHAPDEFRGTAGFGFWNQPIMPGQRLPRLPCAAWFFYAGQPCDMQLAKGVSGAGWKAATLDATRPAFLALVPTAPLAVLLMRNRALYNRLYPTGQRALGVAEALVGVDPREVHTYTLEWERERVTFSVDDRMILQTRAAPRGPLGFVAWVDNQYAVVTPQGRLGFGLVATTEPQWMRLEALTLASS